MVWIYESFSCCKLDFVAQDCDGGKEVAYISIEGNFNFVPFVFVLLLFDESTTGYFFVGLSYVFLCGL